MGVPLLALSLLGCTGPELEPGARADRPAPAGSSEPAPTVLEATGALQFDGPPPTHVLMISIDTLRADHVDAVDMPFLWSLAQTGVRLDDHLQCSNWTFHSTSCTLAGSYPEDAGFVPVISPKAPIPDGQRTLAVRLLEHGYRTALVSGNPWLGETWNNAQGYEEFPKRTGASALEGITAGLEWAASLEVGARWLVQTHVGEPHAAYVPPAEYLTEEAELEPVPWDLSTADGQYEGTGLWPTMSEAERDLLEAHLRIRYRGEVRYLDDQLVAAFDRADALGLLDDTLVVVWSDHGEQFWEQDQQSHAWDLTASENDGILIFWAKDLAPVVWTGPTHAVDLVPTVLAALGRPADPADASLSGAALGAAAELRPRFGAAVARGLPRQSVELDGWKLVFTYDGDVRLYDRRADPGELDDVYAPGHAHAAALWAELLPRIERMHALLPGTALTWPADLAGP